MQLFAQLLCVSCNRQVQAGIFNDDFPGILLRLCLLLLFLGPLLFIYYRSLPAVSANRNENIAPLKITPVIVVALLLGIGLGGFLDGIILHQLLQWHQMLSNKLAPVTLEAKSINMFWDGVFESITWLFTFTGVVLLWQLRRFNYAGVSNKLFAGGLLAGWGIFNLADGIFNHYLFRFHNVRENVPNIAAWNHGFLLLSVGMMAGGYFLVRSANLKTPAP